MEPTFFESEVSFRSWLREHHGKSKELLVGFYTTASKRGGITYGEARDQALCFGWIDGVRRNRDAESYTIRFTPRKPKSIWSKVNLDRVEALTASKQMTKAGLEAFENRDPKKTNLYSFEAESRELDEDAEKEFRRHERAWEFYKTQSASYRKAANWWVISAKREETRRDRLSKLIKVSEEGTRLPHLTPIRK